MTDSIVARKRMPRMRGAALRMLYDSHLQRQPKFGVTALCGALAAVGFSPLYMAETRFLVESMRDDGLIQCTIVHDPEHGNHDYVNIVLTSRGRSIVEGRIVDPLVDL